MHEFYLAPRGSLREVVYLAENWDYFLQLRKLLNLPRLGLLLVPTQLETAKAIIGFDISLAMDNGAFQLLKADFDSQLYLTRETVSNWLQKWLESALAVDWKWVALLDVPVHGRKFVEKEERMRRIRLTTELHKMAFSAYERENGETIQLRAVLQGYEVNEYLTSYQLHKTAIPFDRINPVVAVGSVCVRKDSSLTKLADGKARGTAYELTELLNKMDRPLHFFGLHGRFVRKLKDHPRFYSADSGAAGAVFRWEVRDIKKRLGLNWDNRLKDYLLAHLVQYVRSTVGLRKKGWQAIKSLF